MDDSLRVSILSEALPYIQSFSGRKIVIKYGGSIMEDEKLKKSFFRDIALLSSVGVCPIVIHGGGPEINCWLDKLAISRKKAVFNLSSSIMEPPYLTTIFLPEKLCM